MIIRYSDKEKRKLEQTEKMRDKMKKDGIAICKRDEEQYPRILRQLSGMSPVLYYKGNIGILNQQKSIALIGTRTPSDAGKTLSYESGRRIGTANINLVNGLALGCDAEALKGALAAGGKCVAVMPCGLDEIIPKVNQRLAEEILEKGGCLISEYPPGTKVQKYSYVQRDRLQSGVSREVVIVEAELKSGTMHTAEFAMRQHKRLACYYYKMLELHSGNRYLEDTGKAQVLKSLEDMDVLIANVLAENEDEYEQLTLELC